MDFAKYKLTLPSPTRPKSIVCECAAVHQIKDGNAFCPRCGRNIEAEVTRVTENYSTQRIEFLAESSRKKDEFKSDLLASYGVKDEDTITVTVSALFNYAQNEASSSGLECVADTFDELLSLAGR